MTPFTTYWISVTCAPESISVIRESTIGALLSIRNEAGNVVLYILEDLRTDSIVGVGSTYDTVCIPVCYSFKEAAQVISDRMGLLAVSIK